MILGWQTFFSTIAPTMKAPEDTPVMKQYFAIKAEYPDCILFFRMGDFYEMFYEDAKLGAFVLDIALTARDREKKVPMAGVPYHAVDSYLAKMVKAGYKVAICEQMTEPGSGLVEREVVRVVTPGTVLDEKALESGENNYIMTLSRSGKGVWGLAFCDLSTGSFMVAEVEFANPHDAILANLARFNPVECLLPESLYQDSQLIRVLRSQPNLNIYCFHDWLVIATEAEKILKNHFGVNTLEGFGLKDKPESVKVAAVLLSYLKKTQRDKVSHLRSLQTFSESGYLMMDRPTLINLELLGSLREGEKKGTLLNLLSETSTALGTREMKRWLLYPCAQESAILERQQGVSFFVSNRKTRETLREKFSPVSDLERILARLTTGVGNARDLVALKNSLLLVHQSIKILKEAPFPPRSNKFSPLHLELIQECVEIIESNLVDNPPFDLRMGGLIKTGINPELDDLRDKMGGGKDWMAAYEVAEREKTGINSLKVRNNSVFGFFLEVSKSNLGLVPHHYIRKQTLVNAERFITAELKEFEEIIFNAEGRANEIESQLYQDVLNQVIKRVETLQEVAKGVAYLDCLMTLAFLAEKYHYVCPQISSDRSLIIKGGRHPVVENLLNESRFVPNDLKMEPKKRQLLLVTGPNMAGKSVYMRQTALIVILAQMGSFVPAQEATLPIFDRLFVRSGAADVITSNLSTFMVEMVESANILNHATSQSLIILDEIGRGTSTFDGLSLAWAIVEYLVSRPQVKPLTLFSTHYHELQSLAKKYQGIVNEQVLVEETNKGLNFLHKVVPGGASHSYGIEVAKLAGVPEEVVKRARVVLKILESKEKETPKSCMQLVSLDQLSMIKEHDHPVLQKLRKLQPEQMTPLEALQILADLVNEFKRGDG